MQFEKEFVMKKKLFLLGMLALVAAFGLVVAGCDDGNKNKDTKEALNGAVTIDGVAKIGQTLTANTTGLTNVSGTKTYQWYVDGVAVDGANGTTFALTGAHWDKAITVKVSASGNTGDKTSAASTVAAIEIPFTMLGKEVIIEDRTGLVDTTIENKIISAASGVTDDGAQGIVLARGIKLIVIESETVVRWDNQTYNTVDASIGWLDVTSETVIKNRLKNSLLIMEPLPAPVALNLQRINNIRFAKAAGAKAKNV
jgi:hypothetical protein